MKFILDFVACCRCTNPHTSETDPPELEETRWLVLTSAPIRRRVRDRKRRSSASEWQPSLSAILEDNLSPERERRPSNAGSERILRRKCSSSGVGVTGGLSTSRVWGDGDNYRKYDRPMVIPAFAPTFWF